MADSISVVRSLFYQPRHGRDIIAFLHGIFSWKKDMHGIKNKGEASHKYVNDAAIAISIIESIKQGSASQRAGAGERGRVEIVTTGSSTHHVGKIWKEHEKGIQGGRENTRSKLYARADLQKE